MEKRKVKIIKIGTINISKDQILIFVFTFDCKGIKTHDLLGCMGRGGLAALDWGINKLKKSREEIKKESSRK